MCLHFGFDTFSTWSSSFDMMLCQFFPVWIWPPKFEVIAIESLPKKLPVLKIHPSAIIRGGKKSKQYMVGKMFFDELSDRQLFGRKPRRAEQHLVNLSFWHACYLYNCAHRVNMEIKLLEEKIFPCRRQCFVAQIDKKDGHFLKLQNGTVLALRKKENITVDKRNQGKKDRHISSNKLSLQTDTIVTHGKITKKIVARRSQCFLKPTFTFFPYWPDCNNNKKRRKKDHHISSN